MKISKNTKKIEASDGEPLEELDPLNEVPESIPEFEDCYKEAKTNIQLAIDSLVLCGKEDMKAREAIANLSVILVDLA